MNHDADPYPNHAPMMGFGWTIPQGVDPRNPRDVMIPELSNHYDDRRVVTVFSGEKKSGEKSVFF